MNEQPDIFSGETLRDTGVEQVANHDEAFAHQIDAVIAKFASFSQPFGPDDVRSCLLVAPRHPNSIGAAFLRALRANVIRKAGRRRNRLRSAHAREVNTYIGAAWSAEGWPHVR